MPTTSSLFANSLGTELFEGPDVAGGPSTTASMALDDRFRGTLDSSSDTDWIRVELEAGIDYNISVFGVDGYSSLSDSVVRLRDSAGNEVALNDDAEPGNRHSLIEFRPTYNGVYYIDVSGYNGATGNYEILLADDVYSVDQVASFMSDFAWGFGAPVRLNETDGQLTFNVTNLTEAGKTLARYALEAWENVSGLEFIETSSTSAHLRFDDSQSGAFAGPRSVYGDGSTGYSEINIGTGWLSNYGTTLDSYSFQTYIHEIGHALGLGHSGLYNGSASYPNDALYDNDSWQMTVMSYFSQTENTSVDATRALIMTPMIADVEAIRSIYDLPVEARTGDTVYGVDSTTGDYLDILFSEIFDGENQTLVRGRDEIAFTIFDTGGIDTLNLAGQSGSNRIDLRSGAVSDLGQGVGNLVIAFDTIIENFEGGVDTDVVTGNSASNELNGLAGNDHLKGLGGNDSLSGGDGDDTLDGGTGSDLLQGGHGNDSYLVDNWSDQVSESGGSGFDTILAFSSYRSVIGVEEVTLGGSNHFNLYGDGRENFLSGNTGNNYIDGRAGDDSLYGGAGDDVINGGAGADLMDGGAGNDTYIVGDINDLVVEQLAMGTDRVVSYVSHELSAGVENLELRTSYNLSGIGNSLDNDLIGNAADNRLEGRDGNDTLNGGLGRDTMVGGSGNDIYFVGFWGDRTIESGPNSGFDTVNAYSSYRVEAGIELLQLAGSGNINAYGNSDDNEIRGNSGRNRIDGGGGNDTISGGAGADLFVFGAGEDVITDFLVSDGDSLSILSDLLNGQELQDFGVLVGGDAVFDFGGGNSLTVEDQSTLDLDYYAYV